MWSGAVDGKKLSFHLAGINNENFIMRDEETGSWWQQVSGEAIYGPLRGRKLEPVFQDEITFGAWKRESPGGRVLVPDDTTPWRRFSENWEEQTAKMPVVTPAGPNEPLEPRDALIGVALGGGSKAYPVALVREQAPIVDAVGGVPIVLLVGEDGKTVRAFRRTVDGRVVDFFKKPDASPPRFVDADTASEWDFTGTAVSGPRAGQRLEKVPVLQDYWFDWKTYHPDTAVYDRR